MSRVGVQSYFLFNDTYTLVLIEYVLEARMQMIKSRVRPRAYLEEGHVLVMCPQRANEIKFNKKIIHHVAYSMCRGMLVPDTCPDIDTATKLFCLCFIAFWNYRGPCSFVSRQGRYIASCY